MDGSRLTVVIPAYNEARTIAGVVTAATLHARVLVVDDGSKDDTARLAEEAGATVHRAATNLGYDGALAAGVTRAFAEGAEAVVTMDADGEHDPAILSRFADALGDPAIPLALGVRPRKQRFAEIVIGWLARALYGVSDIYCGMKGYRREAFEANGGFDHTGSIGTELALNTSRRGGKFTEIPVAGRPRADAPRFDRALRANIRLFRAFFAVIARPVDA